MMSIFNLLLITTTTFAGVKAQRINHNQCLDHAKKIVKAINSTNNSRLKRANDEVHVKIESGYDEASMTNMTDLIYTFGNLVGESYIEVSFNIDSGCSFNSVKLIRQE